MTLIFTHCLLALGGCISLLHLFWVLVKRLVGGDTDESAAEPAARQLKPSIAQQQRRGLLRSVPAKKLPWGVFCFNCRRRAGRSPITRRWALLCYRRARQSAADPWSVWWPADVRHSAWRRMANATVSLVGIAVVALLMSCLNLAASQSGSCSPTADHGLPTFAGLMPPCFGMQLTGAALGLLFTFISGALLVKPVMSIVWLVLYHLAIITDIMCGILTLCFMVMAWLWEVIDSSFIGLYFHQISNVFTGDTLTPLSFPSSSRISGRNMLKLVFIFTLLGTIHCTRKSEQTDGDFDPASNTRHNARHNDARWKAHNRARYR